MCEVCVWGRATGLRPVRTARRPMRCAHTAAGTRLSRKRDTARGVRCIRGLHPRLRAGAPSRRGVRCIRGLHPRLRAGAPSRRGVRCIRGLHPRLRAGAPSRRGVRCIRGLHPRLRAGAPSRRGVRCIQLERLPGAVCGVSVGCTHGYELERLPGAVCGVSGVAPTVTSWSAFQAHDAVILVCRTKSRNGYKRVIKANPIPLAAFVGA